VHLDGSAEQTHAGIDSRRDGRAARAGGRLAGIPLQCLREKIDKLDVFILTHGHADHITGMDDLRRFCDLNGGEALSVYTTEEGMARVLAMYPYAMGERPLAKGYAAFRLVDMPAVMELPQGTIQSTLLPHGGVNTLGLIFTERSSGKKFVYYTDCKRLPREAIALGRGADAVVLDGLRPLPHPSHMSIDEAVARRARNRRTADLADAPHALERSCDVGGFAPRGSCASLRRACV